MKMRSNMDPEAETPLLGNMSSLLSVENPSHPDVDQDSQHVTADIPRAAWTKALIDKSGRRFPQTIAHRGYKEKYPENTLGAFKGAVKVGTHAVETDIHLSKDDLVVLSHDADLKRCFGLKRKIIDSNWEFLSQLRTLKPPHEPMPRLSDLLQYMAQPEMGHLWVLLDIKTDTNADDVMRLIAKTIASVPPGPRAWEDRVVLGVWTVKYLPLCTHYLPGFPITHIGFSTHYARQFLKVPDVSFNMLQMVLLGPIGSKFLSDVKAAGRPLFAWTVDDTSMMKWSIQKEIDGVVTDNPEKFIRICAEWRDDEPPVSVPWIQWFYTFWIWILVGVFGPLFRRRFPEKVEQFMKGDQEQLIVS